MLVSRLAVLLSGRLKGCKCFTSPTASMTGKSIVPAAARRLVLASLVFVALAIAHTYPLITGLDHLSRHNDDEWLNAWAVSWISQQLVSNPSELFSANMYFPTEQSLAYTEPLIVPGILGAPVHWLGTSPFSGGGTFYPLKNKDNTSTVLFAPVNQTGTYTLLVHSTLFDGTTITEPISLAAKFSTILADEKIPEIIFTIPEIVNKSFDVLPEVIEKNPDFVRYYLDGEERELGQLPLRLGMLPDGEHDLRIHASDIIGNDVEKTFSFIVDNTQPEILIKSPLNDTTISHSLNIDFEVKDENLAEAGAITILLPNGESLEDITSHSFNVTDIDNGVYDLKIRAVDLAENEQTTIISFNVDHAFVQASSVISKEEPASENNLLIITSAIIVAAILISIAVSRIRKTSRENKILTEDL